MSMCAGVQCEHNWIESAPIHHHLSDPSDPSDLTLEKKSEQIKMLATFAEVTLESGVSKGDLTKIPLMQVL